MTGLQNSRNPALADFDWRGFAQAIKSRVAGDNRSQWQIAKEIGITESDLSRVRNGTMVSVAKALACAEWLKLPLTYWYLEPLPDPAKTMSCSGSNVKHGVDKSPPPPPPPPERLIREGFGPIPPLRHLTGGKAGQR